MVVAINGFGRIGRCVARILCDKHPGALVLINDPANLDILSYLFKYDSVHGIYPKEVQNQEGRLLVGAQKIAFKACKDPKDLDLSGVDVLLETSGYFCAPKALEVFCQQGAKKVLLGAPFEPHTAFLAREATFVLGVNHKNYQNQSIISNASCTTNALAPICMLLDRHFGIESALLTTIHSYTKGQALVDGALSNDKRRSRAAHNIVPTTTRAAKALYLVLPNLEGKMHGRSVRVPTMDVSMVDLSVQLNEEASTEALITLFKKASQQELKGILEVDSHYQVSGDIIGNAASCVVVEDMLFSLGKHAKIMAWYDNEWAYAKRLVDMAFYIHGANL
ncbi:type I glyceraldehyde-3-phosphate dehydrogenase [Helicobacter heilmannii]|uniref:type I glyceraldehyde-3-phosphate dehydrogenase n=1 Tax=Helicobacter heilmannii TaxID=35817 RepID=UPI0006A1BE93|nr:glyceraldehyde 3-phosphate dehydrogenase NAD-binding domain-containing protein [Helicobacter heilmannii]GMB94065.1 Glyceraldehyde-3-phosphate dehydrogenase [Helicobacter heilmannii]CRF46547.1 NAD-dependent glyceraldehyde-3-phosphate dehydrogenase [Helicobacter heilmannii]CRF47963.1 NAD-dependent glyceraldehyde-3-phosphate dehydrogenase [Helicobacter heilmannii]CRF50268.1 NAD-dependent glyceraldehyde-3-phosphate dehydrogenase [Helicobacter heilmannii]